MVREVGRRGDYRMQWSRGQLMRVRVGAARRVRQLQLHRSVTSDLSPVLHVWFTHVARNIRLVVQASRPAKVQDGRTVVNDDGADPEKSAPPYFLTFTASETRCRMQLART